MAAQAWSVYNKAKEYIGDNTIDLDAGGFRMALFKSTSNAATDTLSLYSQLTNQVDAGNGYTAGGNQLSAETWTTGASAGEMRFDYFSSGTFWSCVTSSITSIQFAVIYLSVSAGGGPVLCYSSLSSSIFSVTPTNRLTISPSSNGVFELN